jgi:hypothetical protein
MFAWSGLYYTGWLGRVKDAKDCKDNKDPGGQVVGKNVEVPG